MAVAKRWACQCWQTLRILLPFAFKRALSSTNEVVLQFKALLAYTITLMAVMGYSQLMCGRTYDVMYPVPQASVYLCVERPADAADALVSAARWRLNAANSRPPPP